MMNPIQIKSGTVRLLAVYVTVAVLLSLTLLRVSGAWSGADRIFSWCTVVIGLTTLAGSLIFKSHFRINIADIAVVGWWFYVLGRAWVDATYPASSVILRSTLLLSVYMSLRVLFSSVKISGDIITVCILAVILIEAITGIGQLISGHSHHWRYAVTGTFFNPGPYGVMLSLGPAFLVALWRQYGEYEAICRGQWVQWLFIIALIMIVVPLGASGSRTAWIAAVAAIFIIYRSKADWFTWICLILVAIALIGLLYMFKPGSANGRLLIWYISARNIADSPLIGSGIASFFHSYSTGMERLAASWPDGEPVSAGVLDYAMNFFILVGVEQGIIGLLFAIGVTAIFIYLSCRCRSIIGLVIPVMTLTSLFSYTLELMPFQIITVITAAWLASATTRRKAPKRLFPTAATVISTALAVIILPPICDRTEATEKYESMRGMTHSSFISNYYALLPLMDDNRRFLFDFGKTLREACRYNESNDILRRGQLISNDPMFLVVQGNNYADLGYTYKAEQTYLKAAAIMPNRIYPLYRLLLLYEAAGRDYSAMCTSIRITQFPVKVWSPAINDMRKKAFEVREAFIRNSTKKS